MGTYTGQDKRLQYLFQNGGGGGGTNVEANPQGTPADFLNTIKIGSLIYDVGKIGDIYSTEERQVGVWHDGKPLYQRTIVTPFSGKAKGSRSWILIFAGGQGLNPKYAFGTITIDNYATFIMNGVGHDFADASATNYAYATYSFNNSTGALSAVLRQYFYDGTASGNLTTTLQYTKDSDTAGSGVFVPNGSYARHYSTTEQIIGTWLGQTLYSRVFDLGSEIQIQQSTWYVSNIDTLVPNISNIINSFGISGGTTYPLVGGVNGQGKVQFLGLRATYGAFVRYISLDYLKSV